MYIHIHLYAYLYDTFCHSIYSLMLFMTEPLTSLINLFRLFDL